MREHAKNYAAGSPMALHRLRFAFNAFVSSARSVTFVLQKDLRSKEGEAFNIWYSNAKQLLTSHSNLADARTVTQKEGNRIPLSETEYEHPGGTKYTVVWDLSHNDPNAFVSIDINLGLTDEVGKQFDTAPTEVELQEWAIAAASEYLNNTDIAKRLSESKRHPLRLIINKGESSMSVDELISHCTSYADSLEHLLIDAERTFSRRDV